MLAKIGVEESQYNVNIDEIEYLVQFKPNMTHSQTAENPTRFSASFKAGFQDGSPESFGR